MANIELYNQPLKTLLGLTDRISSGVPGQEGADNIYYQDLLAQIGDEIISQAAEKTTPVDADEILLSDSADTFTGKALTWANIKATLKTYFDTLYSGGGGALAIKENSGGIEYTESLLQIDSGNSETVLTNDSGVKNVYTPKINAATDFDNTGQAAGDLIARNATNDGFETAPTAILDVQLNSTEANITANGQLSNILLAGYEIDTIILKETSGNAAGNISIGTAALGTQIVNAVTVGASAVIDATLGTKFFSDVNDTDLYISSSAWGSGVIQVYFTFKKVI